MCRWVTHFCATHQHTTKQKYFLILWAASHIQQGRAGGMQASAACHTSSHASPTTLATQPAKAAVLFASAPIQQKNPVLFPGQATLFVLCNTEQWPACSQQQNNITKQHAQTGFDGCARQVASQALSGAVSARVCCCCAGTHSTSKSCPSHSTIATCMRPNHCRVCAAASTVSTGTWQHKHSCLSLPALNKPQESCVRLTAAGTQKAREQVNTAGPVRARAATSRQHTLLRGDQPPTGEENTAGRGSESLPLHGTQADP